MLYCDCSLIPACSIIFFKRLGFLSEEELASFELKCTPCFFRERKCSNLAFAAGFGDPGGEGGISRLGTGGKVRSWIKARDAEKGEERPPKGWSLGDCTLSRGGGAGPEAGPSAGPLGGSLRGMMFGCFLSCVFVAGFSSIEKVPSEGRKQFAGLE